MKLTRLELRNWCQHESLDIDFPQDRIVRLYGHNNAGKTNIIRAIGRALAQGRSDFERVSGLRYGAKSGSIRLSALTHEGLPFAIGRTIGKGGHATLEFENTTLTKAEEIEGQLEAWFGPKETLLQLFIARQGKISSLLVEKGRDRLRKFVEICGFKGLLEKQSALNKFMKSYPSLADQSNLLERVAKQAGGDVAVPNGEAAGPNRAAAAQGIGGNDCATGTAPHVAGGHASSVSTEAAAAGTETAVR